MYREDLEVLLSRRKRFTTKENVEDDKAHRGKGTSSKTTLTSSSSSSKTIPLLLCFSSFLPSSSSRVFFRVRRKEEDEVRESHICNVCWSSSPRKNNTLCYILSLSLSCARRTNDAHTFTNTFYYHETTTLVKIQRKSKRKKLGNARKPRKRPRNARTTREPPRKAQGRFGWRKVYNYYSSSFSEDFLTTIFLLPDLAELKLEKGMAIKFPNGKSDLMNFRIEIKPSENYWRGGTFTFTFKVPDSYPHEPPKVLCDQKVYHPNLDTQGNICLNVLREDWSPVQTVTSVIFGLLFLFIDPNASDPLNSEAAKDLMQSTANFKANVRKAMMGGSINGVRFTKVM